MLVYAAWVRIDSCLSPQTVVSVHGYASARSVKHFKDPDSFIPERWLDSKSTDKLSASVPFLIGPGACLGQK